MGSLIVPVVISALLALWFWGPWREPYRSTGGWFDFDLADVLRGIACAAGITATWLVWGMTLIAVWFSWK